MSAKRPRKAKTTKTPAARWNITEEDGEAFERGISNWFESVIEPIFKDSMERQEAEERARQARPKAQIIPFPKAR